MADVTACVIASGGSTVVVVVVVVSYAGFTIAGPPLALCVRARQYRSFQMQWCSYTQLDILHRRRPSRTLARSERGGSPAAWLRRRVYSCISGVGPEGDAKITRKQG